MNYKKMLAILFLGLILIFSAAAERVVDWAQPNGVVRTSVTSWVCNICPDEQILELLVSNGVPEELLLKPCKELTVSEAAIIDRVCMETNGELCKMLEGKMAYKFSDSAGYQTVQMQIGHRRWVLSQGEALVSHLMY